MSIETDQAQAEAFEAAKTGYMFQGEHYKYPSSSRIRAANRMGKRWPNIGVEGLERVEKTNAYTGMLDDIIITLWLQSIKHASELSVDEIKAGAWTIEKAIIMPESAMSAAWEWADGNKLALGEGDIYWEANKIYWQIVNHAAAVAYKVDVKDASPPEDASNLV